MGVPGVGLPEKSVTMPPRKDSVGKSSTTSSEFIEDMNFEGNPDDNHKYT